MQKLVSVPLGGGELMLLCKPLSSPPPPPLVVMLTMISKTTKPPPPPQLRFQGLFLFLNFHKKEGPGIKFTQPRPQALKIHFRSKDGPGIDEMALGKRLGLPLTVIGGPGLVLRFSSISTL